MVKRIIFDTAVFISMLTMAFWLTFLLLLLGLFLFARWWEAIMLALFFELLYAGALSSVFGIMLPATLSAIALFALVELLRAAIRESR